MDIVFNINKVGMEGLGSTLTSLVRNCSNTEELTFWFLCSELTERDKANVRKLLDSENFKGNIEFADFDAKRSFGHLRSLHGDWTAYGRLLIADIVPMDVALYLDADLVINLDILSLKEFRLDDQLVGAVFGSLIVHTLDKLFFINQLGWRDDKRYFNSGVVIMNLQKWRSDNVEKQWKDLANKFKDDLVSHDQTVLNALCGGNFAQLPKEFNMPWGANKPKPELADKSILHFVGSPKPWDLFGKYAHNGYQCWNNYNTPFWKTEYGKMTPDKWSRTWNIRRSLFRSMKMKALSK